MRGLEIDMLSGFDSKLDEFAVDYNARMHSSLKESPDKRFLEESSYLRNIPAIEPVVCLREMFPAPFLFTQG